MATDADSLVREGTAAFKAGNKDKARELLMKAVEIDQYSEQGWLWLSAVVDSVDDQRTCLENVLAINPDNSRARNGLDTLLNQQRSSPMSARSPAASPVEEWPTPGSKSSGATSVEWAAGGGGLETSSASSYRNVPEPSATEYDDWLSNLNLPTATPGQPAMPTTAAFTSPFDDDIDSADFGDGPFSAPSVDDLLNELPPVATAPASRPPEPSIRDAFRSSSRAEAAPAKPPAREKEKEKPKPPKASPKAPARSPAPDRDDPFAGIEGDFDLNSTGLFTSLDDVDPGKLEEMNADELFDYIPEEIKPTRLPGTVERYPTLLMVVLVLLVLLNVGTIALLVYKMT